MSLDSVRALVVMQRIALFGVAVFLLAATTACAASFDCTKAGTKVEKMICADAELSKLDDQLGAVYSEVVQKYPDRASNFHISQREWLKERNRCKTTDCLRAVYRKKITQLSNIKSNDNNGMGWVFHNDQCLKPTVEWSNYKWILMAGKGQSACEDMFTYLKSRPEDAPPPVCPEDRLPPNKNWSRPKARVLNKAEKKALIRNIPVDKPWIKKSYHLNQAVLMQVITADITRDGIPESLLVYSFDDYRKWCHQATQCAVNLNNKQQIIIDEYVTNSYSLLPMNEDGTRIDWNHPVVRPDPMLVRGELIYYKGMPYWLSAPSWFQGAHDNFVHSQMRPSNPYSAMFFLAEIGVGSKNRADKAPAFSEVTTVSYEHDPESNRVCRFGYFSKENLKANPPMKGK